MALYNHEPLVSVVVPVYNVEDWVDGCVRSILAQSYEKLQVILVDDGSTDASGEKCDDWHAADARIEVLHTANGGLSAARNNGMELVRGDYVVFVDSDDSLGENHVSNLLRAQAAAASLDTVAVTGSTGVTGACRDNGFAKMGSVARVAPAQAVCESVSFGGRFAAHAWGKLYPRSLFHLLSYPVGRYYEDQFVTYRVFLGADEVIYEDADDYLYTTDRNESISNGARMRELDYLDAIRETLRHVERYCPEAVAAVFARYLVSLAGCLKISASEGTSAQFKALFEEAVSNRRAALRNESLSMKTRAKFLATLLGESASRFAYRAHAALALRLRGTAVRLSTGVAKGIGEEECR